MRVKLIPLEKLVVRESFIISFRGTDIWLEALDALSVHTELVSQKLQRDLIEIARPSTPSLIGFSLFETLVENELLDQIAAGLQAAMPNLRRAFFAGLNGGAKRGLRVRLKNCGFEFAFFNELEKAKEWLVPHQ